LTEDIESSKRIQAIQPGQSGQFIYIWQVKFNFLSQGRNRHQHELFKKADLGGIAVRYFFSAGPVLAIYKPIYYKVIYPFLLLI